MGYDYKQMVKDTDALVRAYPAAERFTIGESVMEKKIICIKLGDGPKKLFVNGAHHGLEYLTAAFILRFLRAYARAYTNGCDFLGYDVERLFREATIYAVPMVNPDGVDIAVNGIDITNSYHRKLISMVGIHSFNRVWQANANGVDINHNYNAGWRVVETRPCPSKYSGPYSESEPETKAVVQFVRDMGFDMLLAFHSQGGEIYYDFDGKESAGAAKIAQDMAEVSGYRVSVPEGTAAFGGCKDWFIKEFGKAGFTVEIGHGKNPLPEEMLEDIFEENAKIILCALERL